MDISIIGQKTRRAERRTDEELVRHHVGKRLANRVARSTLTVAQNLDAELVLFEQMQVAIDKACAFAMRFESAPASGAAA